MKIVAAIFLILFIWVAIPHVRAREWIAPTAAPAGWWGFQYAPEGSEALLATPPEGYGWFRFDAWNTPPLEGRPVTRDDFRLRY